MNVYFMVMEASDAGFIELAETLSTALKIESCI